MPQITESKYLVTAGWDDVPHLGEKTKQELVESTPPHYRDARTRGWPSLGAGAIYPIPESEIVVKPFQIPVHWPKVYALDVGWKRTAALWAARDKASGVDYIYTEHYRGHSEPSIHADAIKARGEWIPGCIDPAARGRGQKDGERLYSIYQNLGLNLTKSKNDLEAGLILCWQRLSSGRLKVFSSCQNFWEEYRFYQRDEKGHIPTDSVDHLMDCMRYLVLTGLDIAKVPELAPLTTPYKVGDQKAGY